MAINIITEILAIAGGFSVFCLFIVLTVTVKDNVKEKIYEYQIQHRFDKTPTARCYCIDCKYRVQKDRRCLRFTNCYTDDFGFCSNAKPKPIDSHEYNRKQKITRFRQK